MKQVTTRVFQAIVVCIGIAALAALIRFPLTEGRAINLDVVSIYADPFIIYGYAVSIAFFVGLYQVFKLLGYIGQGSLRSLHSAKALRTMKQCASILGAGIIVAVVFIATSHHPDDDPAGFIALGVLATLISTVVALVAARFERMAKNNLAA